MNAHNILTILVALIRSGAHDMNFLKMAPTLIAPRISEFDPNFLAWLVQRYTELGIQDNVLTQAAEMARWKNPEAFVHRNPLERFPSFMTGWSDRSQPQP